MATIKGAEDYSFYFGATASTLQLAGDLRRSMTKSEKMLWEKLRNKQVDGFRFRRQHPIKDFIVDFFCYRAMLVIEVDGSVHLDPTQAERDEERTRILKQLGIRVIRFSNQMVESNLEFVLLVILAELQTIPLQKRDGSQST